MLRANQILLGDCVEVMAGMSENSIPLTLTSPPYDGLFPRLSVAFNFPAIAAGLWRVTRDDGGVVVWVVRDQQTDGGESGTSFRQALIFQSCGFKLQTLIMEKNPISGRTDSRYGHPPEYAFVLIKGDWPRTFNPLKIRTSAPGRVIKHSRRDSDGKRFYPNYWRLGEYRNRSEVWRVPTGIHASEEEWIKEVQHGGLMPEPMARDFILSYSRPLDLVFDPMAGLGTTPKMAYLNNRLYLGVEVDPEFHKHALRRLDDTIARRRAKPS
jgi:site-specific DNA-methyltransferase (adenine-specific)